MSESKPEESKNPPSQEDGSVPPPSEEMELIDVVDDSDERSIWVDRGLDLLGAGMVVVALSSVIHYASPFVSVLEYFSNFVPQYFLLSAFSAVVFTFFRDKKRALGCLVVLAVNFLAVAPWYLPPSLEAKSHHPPQRFLLANIYTGNHQHEKFIHFVKDERPQVIAVLEINDRWHKALGELREGYHYVGQPREDNFGVALFSNYPFIKSKIVRIGSAKVPSILAEVNMDGEKVTIFVTHPLPPFNLDYFRHRNHQLQAVGEYLAKIKGPLVLMGDLNLSLWSQYHRELTATADLVNTRRGYGVIPTWPTKARPFFLGVDHILVRPRIHVADFRRGPHIGSDHYPVIADLSLPVSTK